MSRQRDPANGPLGHDPLTSDLDTDPLAPADNVDPDTSDHDAACIHCGQPGRVRERTLRFTGEEPTDIDLPLCEECLASLAAAPGTTLI